MIFLSGCIGHPHKCLLVLCEIVFLDHCIPSMFYYLLKTKLLVTSQMCTQVDCIALLLPGLTGRNGVTRDSNLSRMQKTVEDYNLTSVCDFIFLIFMIGRHAILLHAFECNRPGRVPSNVTVSAINKDF